MCRVAASVGCVGMAMAASLPAHARADVPSLRLVRSTRVAELPSFGRRAFLDLGVFVASTGGDFQLRVGHGDYGSPVQLDQVDGETGAVLRELPSRLFDGWTGLPQFLTVSFRRHDRLVAKKQVGFCPNGFIRERVRDDGPLEPRYPEECGSRHARFPFTLGMPWGIDRGWAAATLGSDLVGRPISDEDRDALIHVPEGRYAVTVRIAKPYRRLLDVSATDAVVHLHAKAGNFSVGSASREREAHEPRNEGPRTQRKVATTHDPDPNTLPDLVSLPAWNIGLISRGHQDRLRFSTTEWNTGPGRLVVEGFRRRAENKMHAYQYFYDSSGEAVSKAPVGTLRFDTRRGHNHWHFEQFARYSLVGANGVRVASHKQSFCLSPDDPVDLTVPGAEWQPRLVGLSSACGTANSIWTRESLPVGWGDTYSQTRGGQAIDLKGVQNGWYRLQVKVNPTGALYERSSENDVASRRLHLSGRPGHRRLKVMPWHGIRG